MILTVLIVLPILGGLLAWLAGRGSARAARWVAIVTMVIHLALIVGVWLSWPAGGPPTGTAWIDEVDLPWIQIFGISYHLGLDGVSLLLVALTSVLGLVSVGASWGRIDERVGFYHFMLLWILGAIVGVFVSLDLFLFYFFWEMTLVPLYFLIGIWGHENRTYAALKFFIFTQAGSLLMLVAILGLVILNAGATGTLSFNYNVLLHTALPATTALWLSLGFLAAFLVKLPAVPFHTWLPDAHTEAPTAGSVVLAGLVLKLGAYGILRFVLPLFPGPSHALATLMMVLGAIGVLYGALVAYGQTDFKRLVAYTSVSHMGFVLVGLFAQNQYALQGALVVMLAHGVSTGALFVIAGSLQDRMHTRELGRMGGLWDTIPKMGGMSLLFAVASLGLPGLGNFVGEILVLIGAYQANITLAVLTTLGFIGSTVYSLWLIQRAFQGSNQNNWKLPDLTGVEMAIFASLTVLILWLGLYPQTVISTAQPALQTIEQSVSRQASIEAPAQAALPAIDLPGNASVASQEGQP